MRDDEGWIRTLLDEAENERMHLMTFIEIAQPNAFERFLVVAVQMVFYNFYFFLYLFAPRTGAPRGRLFRRGSGVQLHPIPRRGGRGAAGECACAANRDRLLASSRKKRPPPGCAMSSLRFAPTRPSTRDVNHYFVSELDNRKAHKPLEGQSAP